MRLGTHKVPVKVPAPQNGPYNTKAGRSEMASCLRFLWRRGLESNQRITVLQTAPLATWVPRQYQ